MAQNNQTLLSEQFGRLQKALKESGFQMTSALESEYLNFKKTLVTRDSELEQLQKTIQAKNEEILSLQKTLNSETKAKKMLGNPIQDYEELQKTSSRRIQELEAQLQKTSLIPEGLSEENHYLREEVKHLQGLLDSETQEFQKTLFVKSSKVKNLQKTLWQKREQDKEKPRRSLTSSRKNLKEKKKIQKTSGEDSEDEDEDDANISIGKPDLSRFWGSQPELDDTLDVEFQQGLQMSLETEIEERRRNQAVLEVERDQDVVKKCGYIVDLTDDNGDEAMEEEKENC